MDASGRNHNAVIATRWDCGVCGAIWMRLSTAVLSCPRPAMRSRLIRHVVVGCCADAHDCQSRGKLASCLALTECDEHPRRNVGSMAIIHWLFQFDGIIPYEATQRRAGSVRALQWSYW